MMKYEYFNQIKYILRELIIHQIEEGTDLYTV